MCVSDSFTLFVNTYPFNPQNHRPKRGTPTVFFVQTRRLKHRKVLGGSREKLGFDMRLTWLSAHALDHDNFYRLTEDGNMKFNSRQMLTIALESTF